LPKDVIEILEKETLCMQKLFTHKYPIIHKIRHNLYRFVIVYIEFRKLNTLSIYSY